MEQQIEDLGDMKYYTPQADSYYIVPKVFDYGIYRNLSYTARALWYVLKDRWNLSNKNNWIDDNDSVYIVASQQEIAEMMNLSRKTVNTLMQELIEFKLIRVVKRGLGKPSVIYLQNIDYSQMKRCNNFTHSDVTKGYTGCNEKLHRDVTKSYTNNNYRVRTTELEYKENNTKESLPSDALEKQSEQQGSNQANNSNSKPTKRKRKSSVFQKPTIEELNAYGREIGYYGFDAERFFDYYERVSWRYKGNKITDWKAAVRMWKRNSDKWNNQQNQEQAQKELEEANRKKENERFNAEMKRQRDEIARRLAMEKQ